MKILDLFYLDEVGEHDVDCENGYKYGDDNGEVKNLLFGLISHGNKFRTLR